MTSATSTAIIGARKRVIADLLRVSIETMNGVAAVDEFWLVIVPTGDIRLNEEVVLDSARVLWGRDEFARYGGKDDGGRTKVCWTTS